MPAVAALSSLLAAPVRADAQRLRAAFHEARPFRHVVIDDFLERASADALLSEFPGFEQGNFIGDDGQPGGKSTVARVRGLGSGFRALDDIIQSKAFLGWLGEVTGIPDLLYDPFYLGGGTHENRHGQSLAAHVDFNYHPSERWHRRLNLIVYLNPQWDAAWGGSLQLFADPYADSAPALSVTPAFNRCVIFETTEHSWHGFDPIMLPDAQRALSRKSVALYFYSRERPAEETAGRHTTHYVHRQLPTRIQADYRLDANDVDELRGLLQQRDALIRQLYDENSQLLQAQDRGLAGKLIYLAKRLYVRGRR
ncbi:MAG TPA: 2OG-Fe(II) oxygenase [Arenimonas sp.]|nr:2OG-Fe(II) oxygenase [Arenimonas sp.]